MVSEFFVCFNVFEIEISIEFYVRVRFEKNQFKLKKKDYIVCQAE